MTNALFIIELKVNLTGGVFLAVYRAVITEAFNAFIIVTRAKNAVNINGRYARETQQYSMRQNKPRNTLIIRAVLRA